MSDTKGSLPKSHLRAGSHGRFAKIAFSVLTRFLQSRPTQRDSMSRASHHFDLFFSKKKKKKKKTSCLFDHFDKTSLPNKLIFTSGSSGKGLHFLQFQLLVMLSCFFHILSFIFKAYCKTIFKPDSMESF